MGMLIIRHGVDNFLFGCSSFVVNHDNRRSGNVTYVDQATATSSQLTFVNSAGNAIVKVDNTTTILPAPQVNRNSVSRCHGMIKYVFTIINVFCSLGPPHFH
jgi:hypothetical protein